MPRKVTKIKNHWKHIRYAENKIRGAGVDKVDIEVDGRKKTIYKRRILLLLQLLLQVLGVNHLPKQYQRIVI